MIEWTGERFIPWMQGAQIHYEHIHRYAFASQFVEGKKVLDLACGEGYGSYALSKNAKYVVGVDIDVNAVQHARNKYTTQNLEFIQGSILEIPIQGNEKFDVVICFEGIEHVEEHEKLLSEVKRLLNKDGVFIVSSPNKKTYSDDLNFNNPFHKKELYFNDFRVLLDKEFSSCIFFGQKVYSSSNIWSLPPYQYSNYKEFIIEKQDNEFSFSDIERKTPLYFIAIASDKKLDNQIYNIGSHLVDVSNILIRDLEKQVGMLTSTVGDRDKNILELTSALQARDAQVTELTSALQARDAQVTELTSALQVRDAQVTELTSALQVRDAQVTELTSALQSIHQSIIWRSVIKYSKLIDTLLPHGTYRRRFYDGWLFWMRGIANKNKDIKKENTNTKSFENSQQWLKNNDTLHEEKIISQYSHKKIKNMDIICFPIINWDFRYQRSQHLITRFAKNGYRVFYLTVDLTPLGQAYCVREIEKNVLELKLSISSNYNVYTNNLSKKQIESLQESLNKVKIDFNIDKALSLVEFPNWEPLVSKLKETNDWVVLYDCMDEHTFFSNTNRSVLSNEVKLFKESDVVAVTSKHLYEKAKDCRKDVIFIPNAGEFEHFNKLPENNLLADIKKPIIGYYGAIAEWFDNELIEYLATKRKYWNFVFIGHTFGSSIKKLETYPNVHFVGEKSYAQLPKYLYWFDVCMIPFKLTPLIKATHPVKFYEYLSPGKPVVSVKLPELLPYSDLCYIAEDKEEFLDKIEIALKENDPIIKNRRIEFAKNNTWEDRYRVLISNVESLSEREDSK